MMKKSLKVKELKQYLESMSDDAEIIVQTRYGKISIGLIESMSYKNKEFVVLNVVYDE